MAKRMRRSSKRMLSKRVSKRLSKRKTMRKNMKSKLRRKSVVRKNRTSRVRRRSVIRKRKSRRLIKGGFLFEPEKLDGKVKDLNETINNSDAKKKMGQKMKAWARKFQRQIRREPMEITDLKDKIETAVKLLKGAGLQIQKLPIREGIEKRDSLLKLWNEFMELKLDPNLENSGEITSRLEHIIDEVQSIIRQIEDIVVTVLHGAE